MIFTAKGAKTANKKGSVPCSSKAVPGGERGKVKGSVRCNLTAKHAKIANKKGVSLVAPIRFRGERGEKKPECPLYFLVRTVRVVRGS